MQSIESSALEPTRGELAGLPARQKIARLLPVYGLVILTVLLILLFSILLPNTFPTLLNLRSIISDKAIIALLSLAAMIPMASGRIDLTVGYGIVLWHILAISLQTMFGVPWPLAVLIVLAARRRDRLPQRPAGRGRPDRLLHRHARHRHRALCAGALAHWRPAGRRRAAGRLLCAQRHHGVRAADHRLLCAGDRRRAVDRPRIPADRPLRLCHRRQSEGGGAERHSGAPLRHRRLRLVRVR